MERWIEQFDCHTQILIEHSATLAERSRQLGELIALETARARRHATDCEEFILTLEDLIRKSEELIGSAAGT